MAASVPGVEDGGVFTEEKVAAVLVTKEESRDHVLGEVVEKVEDVDSGVVLDRSHHLSSSVVDDGQVLWPQDIRPGVFGA